MASSSGGRDRRFEPGRVGIVPEQRMAAEQQAVPACEGQQRIGVGEIDPALHRLGQVALEFVFRHQDRAVAQEGEGKVRIAQPDNSLLAQPNTNPRDAAKTCSDGPSSIRLGRRAVAAAGTRRTARQRGRPTHCVASACPFRRHGSRARLLRGPQPDAQPADRAVCDGAIHRSGRTIWRKTTAARPGP